MKLLRSFLMCTTELEQISIQNRSVFGVRAIANMLSSENFFIRGINVGYVVHRKNLSSSGLSFTTLLLYFDPHWTAVSQNYV